MNVSDINAVGNIVGGIGRQKGTVRASGSNGTSVYRLPDSGFVNSWAFGINDKGQVVGDVSITNPLFGTTGVVWTDGKPTPMSTKYGTGVQNVLPTAISNNGWVSGYTIVDPYVTSAFKAFEWRGGTTTFLPGLGGNRDIAASVNDSGVEAGTSNDTKGLGHAVIWTNGKIQRLGELPGDLSSTAMSIDAAGTVVGDSYAKNLDDHPFIYQNGRMSDLNQLVPASSGYHIFNAQSINDAGQIVAAASLNGAYQLVVLNPVSTARPTALIADVTNPSAVPEPAAVAVLAVVGALGRRHRGRV